MVTRAVSRYMAEVGIIGRKRNTPKQQEASRENGKKGGRPRSASYKPRRRPKKDRC